MGINSKTGHSTYQVNPTAAPMGTVGGQATVAAEVTYLAEAVADTLDVTGPVAVAAGSGDPDPESTPDPTDDPVPQAPANGTRVSGQEPLTPVPASAPLGVATGQPVLTGGADLVDSTATLVSYAPTDPASGEPREVLLATVREAAEEKLLAAVALSDRKMIPVVVEEDVHGRIPRDQTGQLHELVAKAARSVNHKLKTGAEIPPQTHGYLAAAEKAVAAVENDPNAPPTEQLMASHYRAHLDQVHARATGEVTAAYDSGGKIPTVDPYLHHGTATVTKLIPAPAEDPPPGQLPATARPASRLQPTIDPHTGVASWDGTARAATHGQEYLVDLGDGYSAVYRPHGATSKTASEFSLRGQVELHAPAGSGHGPELVRRLGQLNLVNRPMTAAEGEWTYLEANITAQSLAGHPQVATAVHTAGHLEDLEVEEIFHTRAHEAIGLDQASLHELARDIRLEAQARVLPKKVRLVREAVAHATGHGSGDDLASAPGYDPTPHRSGGWLTWRRFDVDPGSSPSGWAGRSLVHRVTGGNLAAVLGTGVLASTERRAQMGVSSGLGMSEHADKQSGGASSVFLRVTTKPKSSTGGPALIWDDPAVLLARSDYYAYPSDHFGSINPAGHHSMSSLTRDPAKIAGFASNAGNEMMFRNGIDLLGAEAPSRIRCGTEPVRNKILKLLAIRGITHLRGRPVDQVVLA